MKTLLTVKRACLLVSCIFLAMPSLASTWNTFAKAFNTESALFFFDSDTVIRQPDMVTLWVKYVNTKAPDADGSWLTAQRYVFTCSKRTAQVMTTSLYDKDGKFFKSLPNPGRATDIVPDTILEQILQAVCTSDFPKNKSRDLYFPVEDNDIVSHTKRWVEYVETLKDKAPQ